MSPPASSLSPDIYISGHNGFRASFPTGLSPGRQPGPPRSRRFMGDARYPHRGARPLAMSTASRGGLNVRGSGAAGRPNRSSPRPR